MNRTGIVGLIIIFMFSTLAIGLVNLSIIRAGKYRDLSNKNCIRLLPQEGSRGRILDREGNIIVDTKLTYDLMILPQGLSNQDGLLSAVSGILGMGLKDLKDAYKSGYIASSMPVVIAKNIDLKKSIALEELRSELPAILIQPHPLRHYPHGKLASHVLGYISEIDRWRLTKLEDYGYKTRDLVGFGGVEERYDYFLRQEEGGQSFEVDHRGNIMRTLGFKLARNGKDLQLTLNLRIQRIVDDALSAKPGCVILMDPHTGEIIAMSSSPNFAPSLFVDRPKESIASLFHDPDAPLINRAISARYPAGSIFKLIVAAAAQETRKINLRTSFLCTGAHMIGRQKFACWQEHGEENLIEAITHSCNVFFYKTGLMVGAQAIHDYACKFGLSKDFSFELPYEISGFIPSPLFRKINKLKNWYDGDTANLSIGQGEVLVTPLEMARMMAVFANGGNLVKPYIVKSVEGRDISVYQKRITRLHLKENTIDAIRQGLKGVVSDPQGTGNVLSGLPVSVAGKTGTAQAPPGQAHAWFVGYFPVNKPKFVICVLLERGGPGYYSCVLAKQIIQAMVSEGLL